MKQVRESEASLHENGIVRNSSIVEVVPIDPFESRMRLGFVKAWLESYDSLAAECLRVKAKALTQVNVMAMDNREVI